ncbi:hypothetical protein [Dyadobacter sp. NIV53]|uniref:hypothetical protein n=1 Tax=Dyadobacter sp. NIV53 TaxID=2861765 RepID=UPI001C87042D|nr:hypothetical protein [Dyadobacter sp. NIV53]
MHQLTPAAIDQIIQVSANSDISNFRWKDRGKAPLSYIKGMSVVYANVLCKWKNENPFAIEMAKANTGLPLKDALSWYNAQFQAIGLENDTAGVNTLRHLFVLLIGLGMRESSGRYCTGRDTTATNTTAETAEAGMFQTSFNAGSANLLMPLLFDEYLQHPNGFVEIFREDIRCRPADLENFGSGPGKEFQQLSKDCPAFAAEFAAIGLRNVRKHWGPINRHEAEIRLECDEILLAVQEIVDRI